MQKFNTKALKKELAKKLETAIDESIYTITDNTPIDTKRLFNSTRTISPTLKENVIDSGVVAGGLALFGELRESDIRRDVDYAIFVENRTGYIYGSLPEYTRAVIRNLEK